MTYPGMPQQPAAEPMVTMVDPMGSAGGSPAIRHLDGRTVAIVTRTYNPLAPGFEGGPAGPGITFDVYVLDGGPLLFGDKEKPAPTPATKRTETPTFISGCLSSNSEVVKSLQHYAGMNQPVAGRVVRGTQGQRPWFFVPLGSTLDPRAAERETLWPQLLGLIGAHRSNQFQPPTVVDLGAAAPSPAPQAYPQNNAYAPQVPQVNYGQQPPAAPVAPQLSVPQVPTLSVPQLQAPPAHPRPWDPRYAAKGWSEQVWNENRDKMTEETYRGWLASV